MPVLNLASDLLEVTFTPQEQNTADQLMDKNMSLLLLQNTRVGLVRQLATFVFTEVSDVEKIREHSYLRGKLDQLDELIANAHNPTPIPVPGSETSTDNFSPEN